MSKKNNGKTRQSFSLALLARFGGDDYHQLEGGKNNNMSKFVVADDHPLFRNAICQVLKTLEEDPDIVEAQDMTSLQTKLTDHPDADLVLLDLHMPGAHGFSALAYVKGKSPTLPVLVVSANEKPEIMQRAVEFGSHGFLPKSASIETIQTAIHSALQGEIW